ncbi:hypothetical protein [Hyphomicrobium sp. ghe19]|uniref:hypothetical protein n=1 Tax=Hyphomicrobium sp. ghe19 TaxID=2682968 RepID=UPI00136768FA|nr:hypothetical protein HYPP_00378 [Hyphomicrobium sp. ghe19]
MKVFWSWQSDTPGKIGRHFVREALEQAIAELNSSDELSEAMREISLDHDRKGVPGSPDLANTILEKIAASDVFVADVTAVGTAGQDSDKRLINSNVAIELGYALHALSDRRLIMVMNEAYGSREDLPFDLRHKAGPIIFDLGPQASNVEIKKIGASLAAEIKIALKAIRSSFPSNALKFERQSSNIGDPSRFVEVGSPIVSHQNKKFFIPEKPVFYLRVIPTAAVPALRRADALTIARQGPDHLWPFGARVNGASWEPNAQGAIAFDADWPAGVVRSAAQLFLSREIWGFDAELTSNPEGYGNAIPWGAAEQAFRDMLPKYLKFAVEKLGVSLPVDVVAGAFGVRDYVLLYRRDPFRDGLPALHADVEVTTRVASLQTSAINSALLKIFDAFFDAAGIQRPKNLYDFPGEQ